MIAIPTTSVTILGGESTSEYGDVLDSDTPAGTGIPASIVEGRQVVATEGDTAARVIRYYTARLPWNTVVTKAQRLRDDRSGTVYVIDNVTQPVNPVMEQDLRLDLRRVE